MHLWQALRDVLPAPIDVEPAGTGDSVRVRIRVGGGGSRALFDVIPVERLTSAWLDSTERRRAAPNTIVLYAHASREAREALRAAGISYAGERDGRLRLIAPGLFVERDELPQAAGSYWLPREVGRVRSPYAVRTSRVPRWLLLHPHEVVSVTSLAAEVELSESVVSRAVRALDDAAVVDTAISAEDARRRAIRLARPRELLTEWARVWEHRRISTVTWDVGARDAREATELLASVQTDSSRIGWALGGLSGAARMRRAVDPADVLVWAEGVDDVALLAAALRPRIAARGRSKGDVRVARAPDPWVLGLAQRIDGLPVADPVQLWLDCATEGERALEAADAIAEAMGW